MNLSEAMDLLPATSRNVVSVLSGGLDSSIMTMLLVHKYGSAAVKAVSYDYGQKQKIELTKAQALCAALGVDHTILDLSILGDIAKPISANISGSNIDMPHIKEVLGDPQPKTYVPFRNMILLSLTLAKAEASGASHVFTGLQVHDQYGYWDTTNEFVSCMNALAAQNRSCQISIEAPFSHLSKWQEIDICKEMEAVTDFSPLSMLQHTMTCYNPNESGMSCGVCPSCSERIANFGKSGMMDPVPYSIDIPWGDLCVQL
jgi:7-cyano-7-deazaguanine synthase